MAAVPFSFNLRWFPAFLGTGRVALSETLGTSLGSGEGEPPTPRGVQTGSTGSSESVKTVHLALLCQSHLN